MLLLFGSHDSTHSHPTCSASESGLIIGVSIVVGFVMGVLSATRGIDDTSFPGSVGEGVNPSVGAYQLQSIIERQNMLRQHDDL